MNKEEKGKLDQALEHFIASDDFEKGVIAATRSSWESSGWSVELFFDGSWSIEWDAKIEKGYISPGQIIPIPVLNLSDYQEGMDGGMDEEMYFLSAFMNQREDLVREIRQSLETKFELYGE